MNTNLDNLRVFVWLVHTVPGAKSMQNAQKFAKMPPV
tara:strand:+ start:596 stop:706 length:111 start_codon:yes stop_codon:yes gene_type:complete